MLEEAHQVHPFARWWVKADEYNIVSGLEESLQNEWNGDADLETGQLLVMYQKYLDYLRRVESLTTLSPKDALNILLQARLDLM